MANKPDTYTARESAQLLGVSVKRVRQLIQEGKLKQYGSNPVRIRQTEVISLREQRAEQGKTPKPQTANQDSITQVLESLNATFRTQLEVITDSNRRNEENYLAQLAEKQARIAQLEQELAEHWKRKRRFFGK
jgi:excisionase family DNA binding protein